MPSDGPRLTSPGKVLWPEPGITKMELWDYVEAAADRLLGAVAGRALTLLRHPAGVAAKGFLQKNLPEGAPDWLPRQEIWTPASNRVVAYLMAADVDDLRWMANQNTVEMHAASARVDRPDRPDLLTLDLDPSESGPGAPQAARWVREVLDDLGLVAGVKTSGRRGLHVVVPIERRYDFEEVRAFGLATARWCADRHPDDLTVAMRKADRGTRLLLDWSRNGGGQTVVAAWSPRATPAATISTPLAWDEVVDDLDPTTFTLRTVLARPDHWADLPAPQRLERPRAALEAAGYELVDASPRGRVR